MIVRLSAWSAYLSAALGLLALLGVLCFHYPELLTSREFRQIYSEDFARNLLLFGLGAAFALGTLAVLLGHHRRIALTGVVSATLAVLLGGATIRFGPINPTPFSLGLDWFIVSLFFSALVFLPIERLLGQRAQEVLREEWRTDLAYYFVGHVGIQFILIAATATSGTLAGWMHLPWLAAQVAALPLLLQFVLAVFIADLSQALLHRAYHRVPCLWRFHAVHHSSVRIDWLAGSRMHLLEILLTRAVVLAPLLAFGFAAEVINAYVVLVGLQAVLAHANLGLRFGWLESVLVLPRYHHWHHARDPSAVDANYAIHLPLIDRLLGTHRLPADGSWPTDYGLLDPDEVPAGIIAQHLAPFRQPPGRRRSEA
jgi:lathosterol oxidase